MNLSPSLGLGARAPRREVSVVPRIEVRTHQRHGARLPTGPAVIVIQQPAVVKRIAAELLREPALLNLRTRRLAPDVCERFGVRRVIAMSAIGLARTANNSVDSDSRGALNENLCSRCGNDRDRVGQRYCRACHAEWTREWRRTHELTGEPRKKAITRAYSRVLVARGSIERKPCEKCGSRRAQIHHHDYSNARDVNWLCRSCHLDLHRAEKCA